MGGMYHITMLVSGEQEDAIRCLFRDKNWTCCIQALSNEHLAILKQSGFSDMFSLMETSENPDASDNFFKEIKIEINVDNDNDLILSDNQTANVNETEHASKCDENLIKPESTSSPANDDADFSFNSSGNINSSSADDNDNDDTMDYQYTMDNNMVNNKQKPDVKKRKMANTKNNAKIIAPNPAFLMIYPTVSSQLLVSSGQPVGNIIQPMGNMIPPIGNIIQPIGSTIQPVGNMIRPMGNNMQPIGSIVQSSGNMIQTGGSVAISQPIENMKQQGQNISQQVDRKSKRERYDSKPGKNDTKSDSETDSALSDSETDAAKSDSETESDTGPKCSVCGESFMTKTALNKHFETVHVCLLDYGCKDCKASFKTQYELWNHRQVAHPSLETMTADQPEETEEPTNKYMDQMLVLKGYLKCPLCDNMYKRKKTLHQHMKTNHEGSRTYTCDVCGSVYKSYQAYTQHKKDSNHSSSVLKQGTFMCDSCGELLPGYDRLKNHEKTCKNGGKRPEVKKTVPCDECGAMFETEYRVMVHKRAVHTLEPCTCEICGVTKKNRQRLAGHMMRHDPKNKKHSCDECSKAFFTAALLKQHKRVHTKEKPFQCPLCDYRCAAKCNLTKHTLAVHKTPLSALSEFPELSLPVESLPMNLMMDQRQHTAT